MPDACFSVYKEYTILILIFHREYCIIIMYNFNWIEETRNTLTYIRTVPARAIPVPADGARCLSTANANESFRAARRIPPTIAWS